MKNISPNPIQLVPFANLLEPETAWRDVKGATKPADLATRGAQIGKDFYDSNGNLLSDNGEVLNAIPNVNVIPQDDGLYSQGNDLRRWKNIYSQKIDIKKEGQAKQITNCLNIQNASNSADMAGTEASIDFEQSAFGSQMAFDNASTGSGGGDFSFNHLTGSGDNLVLLVFVHSENNNGPNGVTYNGAAMTYLFQITRNSSPYYTGAKLTCYYLVNPSQGTNLVSVDMFSGSQIAGATAITVSGCDQNNPIDNYITSNTGVDNNLVTNYDDSFLVDGITLGSWGGPGQPTVGVGQTERSNFSVFSKIRGATSTKITSAAGSYNMYWSDISAQGKVHGIVALRQASDLSVKTYDAARITAGAEQNWKAEDPNTWDAYLGFHTGKANSVSEKMRLNSDGDLILNLNKHLNFGSQGGDSGYGIRDNNGQVEIKSNGGAWGIISTIADFLGLNDTPSSFENQNSKVAMVNPAENALEFINLFCLDGGAAATNYGSNLLALDGGHSLSKF